MGALKIRFPSEFFFADAGAIREAFVRTPVLRLTHNLTQNRKKAVETTEERERESIGLRIKDFRKEREMFKPYFEAQLITRRSQVQVLSPQPKKL